MIKARIGKWSLDWEPKVGEMAVDSHGDPFTLTEEDVAALTADQMIVASYMATPANLHVTGPQGVVEIISFDTVAMGWYLSGSGHTVPTWRAVSAHLDRHFNPRTVRLVAVSPAQPEADGSVAVAVDVEAVSVVEWPLETIRVEPQPTSLSHHMIAALVALADGGSRTAKEIGAGLRTLRALRDRYLIQTDGLRYHLTPVADPAESTQWKITTRGLTRLEELELLELEDEPTDDHPGADQEEWELVAEWEECPDCPAHDPTVEAVTAKLDSLIAASDISLLLRRLLHTLDRDTVRDALAMALEELGSVAKAVSREAVAVADGLQELLALQPLESGQMRIILRDENLMDTSHVEPVEIDLARLMYLEMVHPRTGRLVMALSEPDRFMAGLRITAGAAPVRVAVDSIKRPAGASRYTLTVQEIAVSVVETEPTAS